MFAILIILSSSVSAWTVLYKTSNIATLWYYNNFVYYSNNSYRIGSLGPFYVPVGFTNQSVYIINIPNSVQNTLFNVKFYPFNQSGGISTTGTIVYNFAPYSTTYVIPNYYFSQGGEYVISNSTNATASFLLFEKSSLPQAAVNSTQTKLLVINSNSNASSSQINKLTASQTATMNNINLTESQIVGINQALGGRISNLTSQVQSLQVLGKNLMYGLALTFVIIIIAVILLFRKINLQAETYFYQSTSGKKEDEYDKYFKKQEVSGDGNTQQQSGHTGHSPHIDYGEEKKE